MTASIDTIRRCKAENRALLSVNVFDYQTFRALGNVFHRADRPVIAQFSAALFQQYEPREIVGWKETAAHPVWLHLDHCSDMELFAQCVDAGFDSVMFDGSHRPLSENIAASAEAVRIAKSRNPGVLIECEIGAVGGVEDGFGTDEAGKLPTVEEVEHFFAAVEPDLLAVGFGNKHGHYRGTEKFDLALLEEVTRRLPHVPFVLHGGSGMDLELVGRIVGWGHVKLNISTDLKVFWLDLLRTAAGREFSSPIAAGAHMRQELETFFERLLRKYESCLLSSISD